MIRPGARILLPRLDMLGDLVLVEGLVAALSAVPGARVTLLVRHGLGELPPLFRTPVDSVTVAVDPFARLGTAEDWSSALASLRSALTEGLAGRTFDAVLLTAFSRTWADDAVAAAVAAPFRARLGGERGRSPFERDAFSRHRIACPVPFDLEVPVERDAHEAEKYAALAAALGLGGPLPRPRLVPREQDREAGAAALASLGLREGAFAVCFPGGVRNVPFKAWDPGRLARIAASVERRHGLTPLLAGDSAEEGLVRRTAAEAEALGARPAVFVGGPGTLGTLAAILEAAAVYVGNDTGPMHLAAAVGTPVVGVFGGGTWPRFRPLAPQAASVAGSMPCFGCHWSCLFGDGPCLSLVGEAEVEEAVEAVLAAVRDRRPLDLSVSAQTALGERAEQLVAGAVATARAVEADRRERLDVIETLALEARVLSAKLEESEADRAARLAALVELDRRLAASEADRKARGDLLERMKGEMAALEADRAARLAAIEALDASLKEARAGLAEQAAALEASEADRRARGDVIAGLEAQLGETREYLGVVEADRAARLDAIHALDAENRALRDVVTSQQALLEKLPVRVLRKLRVV